MGFIRQQEERLAIRFLEWQYQRSNQPVPSAEILQNKAAQIVAEAHRIARKRGKNVVTIMKEMVADIKQK
ncbi:MAG: hypothetical protein P1P89_13930 [Desulfobacterales bacterium]|nr:hypothetical protein [Desulfobacterales bacterium]